MATTAWEGSEKKRINKKAMRQRAYNRAQRRAQRRGPKPNALSDEERQAAIDKFVAEKGVTECPRQQGRIYDDARREPNNGRRKGLMG